MQLSPLFSSALVCLGLLACGGSPEPKTAAAQPTETGSDAPIDPGTPSTTGDLDHNGGNGEPLPAANAAAANGEASRERDGIQAAVQARRPEARACYDAAQKEKPTLEGDIVIRWVITPEGAIDQAQLDADKSTIKDTKLADCLIGVIKTIKFQASPKGFETRANYPFNFHPKNPARATP